MGLVLPCVDANWFIFWDVPGDVLAAPGSALCGWIGVVLLDRGASTDDGCADGLKPVAGLWTRSGTAFVSFRVPKGCVISECTVNLPLIADSANCAVDAEHR